MYHNTVNRTRLLSTVPSPRLPQPRNFAPLGGLVVALFVSGCFWSGVYLIAKWLVKVL